MTGHIYTVYVEVFAGIYFHYFANLKGFVIINSTCSVLLSYICQLVLNSTLHVELIITKPFKLAKSLVKINTSKNFHIYGTKLTQYKVGSKCKQAIVYKQSCVNLKKLKDSILFQPCSSMDGKVWELSLHAVLKRLVYT